MFIIQNHMLNYIYIERAKLYFENPPNKLYVAHTPTIFFII